jgi:hypothetical protein
MITIAEAAAFFMASAARCEAELAVVVTTVVETAAVLARDYIGREHDDWAPLSTATTEGFRHELGFWIPGKIELGYGGAESPLLRTGDLRDSVGFQGDGLYGIVGSDSKVALYQELGTVGARYPIPPRPIFAKALIEAAAGAEILAEDVIVSLLVPQ